MNQAEIDYNQKRLQFFIEESGNHNVIVEKLENSFFASMRGSVYEFLTTGQDWLRRIVVEDDNVT